MRTLILAAIVGLVLYAASQGGKPVCPYGVPDQPIIKSKEQERYLEFRGVPKLYHDAYGTHKAD